MMNINHSPMEDPVIQKSLCDVYNHEHDRSWRQKRQGLDFRGMEKPEMNEISINDYLAECSVLPADAKKRIEDSVLPDAEEMPRNLEMMYPRGLTFCVAALPFMDSGFTKGNLQPARWDEFLNRNAFIKYLTIDPAAQNLTFGMGDVPVFFYDCLPVEIKNNINLGGCTFELDYPYPEGDFRNKSWFLERCKTAINNLGQIVREEKENSVELE